MYPPHAATRNSKDIPSKAYPHSATRNSKVIPSNAYPHAATWILHGIYGSVIAEAGFFRKIRTILLPLLHNSSVSAVLAAFGGSVFNLAITTILYPPNYSTLPVYISDSYNDFGTERCKEELR